MASSESRNGREQMRKRTWQTGSSDAAGTGAMAYALQVLVFPGVERKLAVVDRDEQKCRQAKG